MGYHAIVNGSTIPVYSRSDCGSSSVSGELYNGEVFVDLGITTGYTNVHQICFLNPSGQFTGGFIKTGSYGNLMYSGTKTSTSAGTGYAFTLRKALNLVNNSGTYIRTLSAGSKIYTNNGTAGATNRSNINIIGYTQNGIFKAYDGFVTLDYTSGIMFASNFCIGK